MVVGFYEVRGGGWGDQKRASKGACYSRSLLSTRVGAVGELVVGFNLATLTRTSIWKSSQSLIMKSTRIVIVWDWT